MRYIIPFLAIMLFPVIANAQHADNKNAVCRTLVKHKPADNVIYQPGVDVKGKAVVPADVNQAQIKIPDVVKVPLTIDLAKRIASLTGSDVQMETNLGMLNIHSDGRVMYGDQDWTSPVMTLCGESHAIVEETIIEAAPAPEPVAKTVEAPAKPVEPEKPAEPVIVEPSELVEKPRDPVSKRVDMEGSVKPAISPSMQRVSKPDLRIIEQPKAIEVKVTPPKPPRDTSRVIFNDPTATDSDRTQGRKLRE